MSNNSFEGLSDNTKKANAACARDHREHWRVYQRNANASAFNGYHPTWSAYSGLTCLAPRCYRRWRTKADYVATVPDMSEAEWAAMNNGHR